MKVSPEMKKRLWYAAAVAGLCFVLVAVSVGIYITLITHRIDERIRQLHEAKGSQFFALYPALRVGQSFSRSDLRAFVEDQGYVEAKDAEDVLPGEYSFRGGVLRLNRLDFPGAGYPQERARAQVELQESGDLFVISRVTLTENRQDVDHFPSRPKKIAAFVAGRLRTQSSVPLSDMPVSMRHAIMAIEDVHFLEHPGVSLRGTLRALWNDLRKGSFAEGGSTITQQLMKNLFFSREKAISRKVKEAIFAFVTESRHSKEAILEAYLNEVYFGQMSTHEIHGVSEAARYYFNRPIAEITLAQSALLAAIVQAPGLHDPRRHPDRALKRRNTVLKKMEGAGFIDAIEAQAALKEPLAVVPPERSLDDANYFMDLVMQQLPPDLRARLETESLSIYTTLNPYLQSAASRLLKANIDRLQKLSPSIRAKEKRGYHLQAALIAVSVRDGTVLALQGGKSYKQTQFNRVLQGKRQPGSLFKPFVFLAGFDHLSSGDKLTPLTELEDTPFEWKYEGQSWKPRNYDNEFREKVTAREALEQSLNIPTARLAALVGVNPIRETLIKAGIKSKIPAVPSISLGSAEVTPLEMADAYTTLANVGTSVGLRPYIDVFDETGNKLRANEITAQPVLPQGPSFLTIQLLKGVFTRGTARSALASGIPLANFAGKTGTTNDSKDAWFVGFSPNLLVLVWVGYDEEEKVGLSGSVAALPLWVEFVKRARPFLTSEDFPIPEGVVGIEVDPTSRALATPNCPTRETEYFTKGTEPSNLCSLHP